MVDALAEIDTDPFVYAIGVKLTSGGTLTAHLLNSPFELKKVRAENFVAQAASAVRERMFGTQTNCCGGAAIGYWVRPAQCSLPPGEAGAVPASRKLVARATL